MDINQRSFVRTPSGIHLKLNIKKTEEDRKYIESIEKILDVFGLIISKLSTIDQNNYEHHHLLYNPSSTTKDYKTIQEKIVDILHKHLDRLSNIQIFCAALFITRGCAKERMYNQDLGLFTFIFKAINILFFISEKHNKLKSDFSNDISENKIIYVLFELSYIYVINLSNCNQHMCEDKACDNYYIAIKDRSERMGDMHSYKIRHQDLLLYLRSEGLNNSTISNKILSELDGYISKNNNQTKCMRNILMKLSISSTDNITVIIKNPDYHLLDSKTKKFLEIFEAKRCKEPFDNESELIFTYITDKYTIISLFMVQITQELIEAFSSWGQYESLVGYFFDLTRNYTKIKSKYNKLMTYKIADLLFSNKYILPLSHIGPKNKKLCIPQIELKNYSELRKSGNDPGDIDVLFYSPHTKILYVLEYKNYEMYISGQTCYMADAEKVEDKNIIKKHMCRKFLIEQSLDVIREKFFKNIWIEAKKVTPIVLTTKPNFYQYSHDIAEVLFMDWIVFKEEAELHKL